MDNEMKSRSNVDAALSTLAAFAAGSLFVVFLAYLGWAVELLVRFFTGRG